MTTPGEPVASKPDVDANVEQPPPLRWFRATLEGDYVGEATKGAPTVGKRHRPRVYRARLDGLTWLPDAPSPDEGDAELWQAQIDDARVLHVLGPGTVYEGPVFEVRLREVQLSAATTHRGRAYGRLRAQATGALVMPEKPAIEPVQVQLPGAAPRARSSKPLAAKISRTEPSESRAAGAQITSAPVGAAMPQAPERRAAGLRGLSLLVLAIAVGLGLHGGWSSSAFFVLCALPTLLLRWMFSELLQPSGATRTATLLIAVASSACAVAAAQMVRTCAPQWWWPALAILALMLFACLLPSVFPTAVSFGSWGIVVALISSHAHHCRVPAARAPVSFDVAACCGVCGGLLQNAWDAADESTRQQRSS